MMEIVKKTTEAVDKKNSGIKNTTARPMSITLCDIENNTSGAVHSAKKAEWLTDNIFPVLIT